MRSKLLGLVCCSLLCLTALLGSLSNTVDAAQRIVSLNEAAERVFTLTNDLRRSKGLKEIQPMEALSTAAFGHSKEMLELGYFAHKSPVPGRTNARARVKLAGATASALAENIYMSTGLSAAEVAERTVDAWSSSPGHLRNMLNPDYTNLGVGVAQDGESIAVTQVFARP